MDSSTSLDPMWPVCTKLVGFPIMDRSIRSRWWWRLRRGLCGWWKQHENHCSQISPVLAILPLFSFLSTLGPWFGVGPRVTEARVLPCTNKEAPRTSGTGYGRLDRKRLRSSCLPGTCIRRHGSCRKPKFRSDR